ncbi:hypothetical protein HU200_041307 [Digitaria exilis]|uniref:Uncharacterized protein n=1 Tax=Digitaria exilis TaxID=1010633 RepID=A0A835B8A1_9POAL|nr:hypothetical protein HU200_041307 [Digitaria exilis]
MYRAQAPCDRWDIQVRQALTGKYVEGKIQFRVTISTQCPCPQAELVVRCFGLSSALTVDKTKIQSLGGDLCSVDNGAPIARGSPVVFTYAYAPKRPLYFPVVSVKTQC